MFRSPVCNRSPGQLCIPTGHMSCNSYTEFGQVICPDIWITKDSKVAICFASLAVLFAIGILYQYISPCLQTFRLACPFWLQVLKSSTIKPYLGLPIMSTNGSGMIRVLQRADSRQWIQSYCSPLDTSPRHFRKDCTSVSLANCKAISDQNHSKSFVSLHHKNNQNHRQAPFN